LELLVCGSKMLEFRDWEKAAQYVDGYTADNNVVKWLWEIIHEEMTEYQKKQFL